MAGLDLPAEAGMARLSWQEIVPVGRRFPCRSGVEIFLPLHPENRLFPLEGGRKYLLFTVMGGQELCFFFGQDEQNLFLNQLELGALQANAEWGEDGLNAFLKPVHIKHFERLLGKRSQRQGDVQALWIAPSTGEAIAIRTTEEWPEIF